MIMSILCFDNNMIKMWRFSLFLVVLYAGTKSKTG